MELDQQRVIADLKAIAERLPLQVQRDLGARWIGRIEAVPWSADEFQTSLNELRGTFYFQDGELVTSMHPSTTLGPIETVARVYVRLVEGSV